MFTSEECPLSLQEGDPNAPPDPKHEKNVPDRCKWYNKRTMRVADDPKQQGIDQAIFELQVHFKHENIVTSRRRLTALEKMLVTQSLQGNGQSA